MALTELIARERELAALADAVAAARTSGRIVLVGGEAGIGKSTLLQVARERAEASGARVLSARAGTLERSEGFGVVRQLLERVVATASGGDGPPGLLSGAATHALGVFGLGEGVLDEQARYGLYWLVAGLAEAGPLVIVVDDIQWADTASLDWLLYLARRLADLPILIVAGLRTGEPGTPSTVDALAVEPLSKRLELSGLSLHETQTLVSQLWGQPVDDAFAEACHAWTGGNLHYVAEVVAALRTEGLTPGADATAWMRRNAPERLSTLTLLRLGRLTPDAVGLARAVAILGGQATMARCASLAGLDPDDAVHAADALAAARILGPADETLAFVHPLVASIVAADLPSARRAADHRRAAEMLDADGATPEQVAGQLLQTHPSGDAWVAGHLLRAAGDALAHGSTTSAVDLLRRAHAEPAPPPLAVDVLGLLGLAEGAAGLPEAVNRLATAAAQATDPVQRARLAVICGRFQVISGQAGAAVEQLNSALVAMGDEPSDARLALEAMLITAGFSDPALRHVAVTHLASVRDAATRDSAGGRLVAVQLAFAQAAAGEPVATTAATARRALGDGALLAENPLAPDAYLVPMSVLSVCDELDEAARWYEEASERVRRRGEAVGYAAVASLAARTALLQGRLDDAELLARDTLRITQGAPAFQVLQAFATAHLTAVMRERGDLDAALELSAAALAPGISVPAAARADLLVESGATLLALRRPEDALEVVMAAGRHQDGAGMLNPAFLAWRSLAASILRELGRSAEGEPLVDEELARAQAFGAPRPIGVALRARGLLRRGDDGLADLREAADVLSRSPAVLEYAHTLVALGAALRRAGDRAEARRPLAEGLEIAQRCGATALAATAETELRASGARRRTGGSFDPDALTVAERRVCEMAASGLRNRDIAQALFVTRGTVESQLHVAYRKLGISSRRQLRGALEASGESPAGD